jgi:hypothetical protein
LLRSLCWHKLLLLRPLLPQVLAVLLVLALQVVPLWVALLPALW